MHKENESDSQVLEMAYEALKAVLQSKTGATLYSEDPKVYDIVNMAMETIEFSLSEQ